METGSAGRAQMKGGGRKSTGWLKKPASSSSGLPEKRKSQRKEENENGSS